MKEKAKLLEIRKKLKQKKPVFLREDAHKVKKLAKKWRSPRGIHSKMREKIKGHRRLPSIGWSSPVEVKYLNPEGYEQILIYNVQDLLSTNSPKIISSGVGLKKRLEIVKKAKEKNIKILNIPNLDEFIKKIEENIKKRKEMAKELTKKKVEPVVAKKEIKKEETPEEKEKREREEKKKILEKK